MAGSPAIAAKALSIRATSGTSAAPDGSKLAMRRYPSDGDSTCQLTDGADAAGARGAAVFAGAGDETRGTAVKFRCEVPIARSSPLMTAYASPSERAAAMRARAWATSRAQSAPLYPGS